MPSRSGQPKKADNAVPLVGALTRKVEQDKDRAERYTRRVAERELALLDFRLPPMTPEWQNFIQVLFQGRNLNNATDYFAAYAIQLTQTLIEEDIRRRTGNIDIEHPPWSTMTRAIVAALEEKESFIRGYLQDKRPDMFVNSPLNALPSVMLKLMRLFNWRNIPFNTFHVILRPTQTRIELWGENVFLLTPQGHQDFQPAMSQIIHFLDLLCSARVNRISLRFDGDATLRKRFNEHFNTYRRTMTTVFSPCSDVRLDLNELNRERYYEQKDYDKHGWTKRHIQVLYRRRLIDDNFGGPPAQ